MVHELNRWKSLNLKLQINSFEKKSRVFQLMRKNSQDNSNEHKHQFVSGFKHRRCTVQTG